MKYIKNFFADATSIEYGLIAALIAVAAIVVTLETPPAPTEQPASH